MKVLFIEGYLQLPDNFNGSFSDALRLLAETYKGKAVSGGDDNIEPEAEGKLTIQKHRDNLIRQLFKLVNEEEKVGCFVGGGVLAEYMESNKDWVRLPG